MTEERFRNSLLKKLRRLDLPYKLDKEIPIPYKHIYVKDNAEVTLEIWCFKQDIVFFKPLFDVSVPYRGAAIHYNKLSLIQIKLEKDNAQNSKDVGMPFLIIETKCGQPGTHDVMTYSQKAELIKTIFPYCKFVFCIYGDISARTYRHGLHFDNISSISNLNDQNQIRIFSRTVRSLLKEAEHELKRLST
jgi:hypothetical protein